MRKIALLFSVILLGSATLSAQNLRVSGTVTGPDGNALAGVTVVVSGSTGAGAVTDGNGAYAINAPASGTLVFAMLGMETQSVAIGGRSTINVQLETDAQAIDEVIVVAYGTATKQSFTGSASVISSAEISKRKFSNVTKALDGLAPGVQTSSGGGQPGSSANIIIRGFGSINASRYPLYVVDGIPYSGEMNAINPDDIQNISILKDASASALYGARASNGVVMITTKKGRRDGIVDVDLKINAGISSRAIPPYETLDQKGWIEANYQAFYHYADGKVDDPGAWALSSMGAGSRQLFGANQMYNPFNVPVEQLIDKTTGKVDPNAKSLWNDNWLKAVMRNAAPRQEYVASVSGGTDKSQYMFSLGYLDEKGVLETTSFKRYSARANINAQPKEWLEMGVNVNFAKNQSNYLRESDNNSSATANVFYSAMLMGPVYPLYMRDPATGNLILDANGEKQYDYGASRSTQQNYNSIATLYNDKTSNNNENLSTRANIDLIAPKVMGDWAQGLKLSLNLGADYYNNRHMMYYNPNFGDGKNVKGRLTRTNTQRLSYTLNQLLTWNRSFGDHSIGLLLGHEYYDWSQNQLTAQKTGFPMAGMYELSTGASITNASSYTRAYRVEGFFSRLNYDYADKYYLEANFRRDASSRFHPDNQWGNFGGAGVSWRISEENFLKDVHWLNNLTLKTSYGMLGNDMLLDSEGYDVYYAWQGLYDVGTSTNNNLSGAHIKTLENRELSWESNNTLNAGFEAQLFNRLSVSFEWYNRTTTNMLLDYPKAISSGFTSYRRNVGSMRNRGVEFQVTGALIQKPDFQWDLTVMGSTVRNKVLKLKDDGEPIITTTTIIKEGEAVYSYFLAEDAGVNPDNGAQVYWYTNPDTKEREKTETARLATTKDSRKTFGSRIPDIYGSISTSLRWKNLDFALATNYSLGGKVLDGVYRNLMMFSYPDQAKHVDLKRQWTKPGDVTDIPKPKLGEMSIAYDSSDLIDASYFGIKNITLGYTLPKKILAGAGIKSLRISASADNLALFTRRKGMDPQYNFTGGTGYVYSAYRTISFNLDLKF